MPDLLPAEMTTRSIKAMRAAAACVAVGVLLWLAFLVCLLVWAS